MRNMKVLVEAGANVNARDSGGETALLYALRRARNSNIPQAAEMVEYLRTHNIEEGEREKEQIKRIGTDFEWFRNEINPQVVEEWKASLMRLYELYDLEPVPRRAVYDGGKITVKAQKWQDRHEELWQLLVPAKGHASTVQGEVIRISGKISYEILDNGKINWDEDYKKMARALAEYLKSGNGFSGADVDKAVANATRGINVEDQLADLAQMCVNWVINNPDPTPLEKVEYNR